MTKEKEIWNIPFDFYFVDKNQVCALDINTEKCPLVGVQSFGTKHICLATGDQLWDNDGFLYSDDCFLMRKYET